MSGTAVDDCGVEERVDVADDDCRASTVEEELLAGLEPSSVGSNVVLVLAPIVDDCRASMIETETETEE